MVPSRSPTSFDWLLLALIVAFGGSSFVMIKSAVASMPPVAVAVGRLWVGAFILFVIMIQAGRRLPPFFQQAHGKRSIRRSWRTMIAVGLIGNTLPFFLFPWAQQRIDSGLAGVYMAFMPIWTIILAYLFAGERLTVQKGIGFALGLVGVLLLMGPDALAGARGADLAAQGALLLATLCYAGSAVLARRAQPIRPRIFAAGMMLVAAIAATPSVLFFDLKMQDWTIASILSVFGLGIFPTGINGVLIIMLIRRSGAGFMALTNYITPLWAVGMGAAFYSERLSSMAFIALGLILGGVAASGGAPIRLNRPKWLTSENAPDFKGRTRPPEQE